ncbi:MAG: hypothetical protein U0414_37440 [Polyangiaceae bacterium]
MSRRDLSTTSLGLGSILSAVAVATAALSVTEARANGLESAPDNGPEQLGRGAAWVAKADGPLAAFYNPAAMSFQSNGVGLSVHLMIIDQCFTRKGPNNANVSPGAGLPGPGDANGPDPDVCIMPVFPNPQLAAVFKPIDALGIGIAVVAPHAAGGASWPETVPFKQGNVDRNQPAPQRYLVTDKNALLLYPTISVSYAFVPEFSIGAGFSWGIATADFTTYTEALSPSAQDDFFGHQDVEARLQAADLFVPGFVVGVDARPHPRIELGAWYRYSDSVRSVTDLTLTSGKFLQNGNLNPDPCKGMAADCNVTSKEEAGSLEIPIPMEAKLGLRYHHPLGSDTSEKPKWTKDRPNVHDSLSEDRFDIEVDGTWSHNSAVEDIKIRFGTPECQEDPNCTDSGIPVKGTPGSVPVNGDIPHHWLDVVGVRVGSDVTVIPNRLALRGGVFFESKGQDDEYLNLDFHQGWKLGLTLGGTVRVGPADIHLAYSHVFYGTLDNGGEGAVKALSGDATPMPPYRSRQAINGGSFRESLNEVALGADFRF